MRRGEEEVVAAHTDKGRGLQEEGRGSGGGPSVGETVDPGSASRAACPTIRSLRWGVAVIHPVSFSPPPELAQHRLFEIESVSPSGRFRRVHPAEFPGIFFLSRGKK